MARRPTILVVDDNTYIRNALVGLLTEVRYDVRSAADVAEALAIATEHRPDVVLADAELPGLGAAALLAAIRAQGDSTAVILLSGGHRDLSGLGVPVVSTPFRVPQLLDLIAREAQRVIDAGRTEE